MRRPDRQRLIGLAVRAAARTGPILRRIVTAITQARARIGDGLKALMDSLSQAQGFSLDYKVVTKRGEERVVHHQGEVESGLTGEVERISARERAATPPEFRDVLLDMVR